MIFVKTERPGKFRYEIIGGGYDGKRPAVLNLRSVNISSGPLGSLHAYNPFYELKFSPLCPTETKFCQKKVEYCWNRL